MTLSNALSDLEKTVLALSGNNILNTSAAQLQRAEAVYLLAPSSFIGQAFTERIAQQLLAQGKRITLIDDTLAASPAGLDHVPVLSTQVFIETCDKHVASVAVNMANMPFAHGFFAQAASQAGIQMLDVVPVLDFLNLPVIYQTASAMRTATLSRLDDYLALAKRLEDELSVRTLTAFLKLRITLDRTAVLPILCSLEDEYFSPYSAGKDVTFALGSKEVLCDVGAHVGTTIHKFLTATRWNYADIYAFEPDAGNFDFLKKGVFKNLPNFHPRNIALSDCKSVLQFSETGTMGSKVDKAGNVTVQASTLDDEVPHATFIKMDVEGHETKVLRGARRLIQQSKPRMAITGYHYADDLLDIAKLIQDIEPGYRLRLRQHSFYYYDTILYASI